MNIAKQINILSCWDAYEADHYKSKYTGKNMQQVSEIIREGSIRAKI